jgi:hypothetical protein
MLKILFASFILFNFLLCFSQESKCENRLDTAKVIKIANRHNAYWNKKSQGVPYITFDEQKCTWTVVSTIYRYTNRGHCKNTNGCTIVKTVTLIVDANSKKVISKTKWQKLYHNYE